MKLEPVAWMHKQGDYEEPVWRPLEPGEIERGWTQMPLYAIPDTHVVVPKEPTEEIIEAAEKLYYAPPENCSDNEKGVRDLLAAIYKAMIAAGE